MEYWHAQVCTHPLLYWEGAIKLVLLWNTQTRKYLETWDDCPSTSSFWNMLYFHTVNLQHSILAAVHINLCSQATFAPLTWPGNEAMSLYHSVLIVVLLYCPPTTHYWQYFTVHLQQYWQYLIVHLPHTIGSILLSIYNSIGSGLLSVYEHYHFHWAHIISSFNFTVHLNAPVIYSTLQ